MNELLEELQTLQNEVVEIVSSVSAKDYQRQFHPDLSPLGWHLGHCVYTESYWIRERLLKQQTIDDSLKSLYVPELSHKPHRSSSLPDKDELLAWSKRNQSENRDLLENEILEGNKQPLLENNYLIHFLIQHYSQHIETMCIVLTERNLRQLKTTFVDAKKISLRKTIAKIKLIDADTYNVGSDDKQDVYDNEQPAHFIKLDSFEISTIPVSNSEYLQFIYNDGYARKEYWSDNGWQWIMETQYKHPHHWRIANKETYYGVDINGAFTLEDDKPVYGLSYYEAEAFAKCHGARLPHEHEWEVAFRNGILKQSSLVWEWCNNIFYPYRNFKAYPYEGYSVPYFDGKHFVLKGGSKYSKERIKRSSFRNYYTADKRHIFAGVRLVYD